MHSSRLGKSSKWYNEKRFKKAMALNRKEESLLQQKLEQIQREESFLQREYESKIVKTAQALNARETDGRKISSTTARGGCELSFRGKSSSRLFMKLLNPEMLKRRRHTVAGLTSIINKASEGEKKSYFSKASDSDVLSAIGTALSLCRSLVKANQDSLQVLKLWNCQRSVSRLRMLLMGLTLVKFAIRQL